MNKLITPLLATALLGACAIPNHDNAGPPGFNWYAYYANRRAQHEAQRAAVRAQYAAETQPQAQPVNADLMADVSRRAAIQGAVKHLTDDQCYKLQPGAPSVAYTMGQYTDINHDYINNPYLTPQENWCIVLGRSHESPANVPFPGMLPDGARAVYNGNNHWLIYQD